MTVKTNVKINLGLNVLRRRPDGYHDIETLFVPYHGYGDTLSIEPDDELSISIQPDPTQPKFLQVKVDWDPFKDLTMKAYNLLKADFPHLPPVAINLQKGAPVGAGLGGGSADAAAALQVLNTIFELGLSQDSLAAYAARLGSDCAFFIYNTPMFATGRGEILSPCPDSILETISEMSIFVEMPKGECKVSTAQAYAGIRPCEGGEPLVKSLQRPVEEWQRYVKNDFEPSVFKAYPQVAEFKASMLKDESNVYVAMSGSGSAVFSLKKHQSFCHISGL